MISKNFTNDEVADIIYFYIKHSYSLTDIAKIYGTSRSTIFRILEASGIPTPVAAKKKEEQQIRELMLKHNVRLDELGVILQLGKAAFNEAQDEYKQVNEDLPF